MDRILERIWFVLWKDNSPFSLLISFIVAFILIQYVFYPVLGSILGSELPVVAVISGSMEHRTNSVCSDSIAARMRCDDPRRMICGVQTERRGSLDLEEYWSLCGDWYEQRGIDIEEFSTFPFMNGFNTGDIMVLRSPENIEVGDVIVFQTQKSTPIIHRVVGIENSTYSTKGDYNAAQMTDTIDETSIHESQIIAKAWFSIPWLGYPKVLLTMIF